MNPFQKLSENQWTGAIPNNIILSRFNALMHCVSGVAELLDQDNKELASLEFQMVIWLIGMKHFSSTKSLKELALDYFKLNDQLNKNPRNRSRVRIKTALKG